MSDEQNPLIQAFWQAQNDNVIIDEKHALPLARIKKVMKLDSDISSMMISGEVPILLSKCCELFILELTLRAWQETDYHKRRTMSRSDIVDACSKCDMYDFLVDIIQREQLSLPTNYQSLTNATNNNGMGQMNNNLDSTSMDGNTLQDPLN